MKKTMYYKVVTGFGPEDYIPITGEELKKGLFAQVNGGVVIFQEGSWDGNKIIGIVPDYGRILGVNRGYKLTAEDFKLLDREVVEEHKTLLLDTKMSLKESSGGFKRLN